MASSLKPQDPYIFGRNNMSSIRLNYNHWLVTRFSGFLLHSSIFALSSNLRVADIGAGTGIWLIDLSRDLEDTVTLDGFDISPAQYPPRALLPKNVHLHVHDAFTSFPQNILGTYDVVNVRFWISILDSRNLHTLLSNLRALLKPNGHLQLLDLDPRSARVLSSNSSASTVAMEKIVALMQHPRPNADYDWISGMSLIFRSHELEVLTHEHIPLPDRYRMPWNQSQVMAYEEFVSRRRETQDNGAGLTEESGDELSEEMAKGVSLDADYFCLIARKTLLER